MSTDGNARIRRADIIDDAIGADEVEDATQTFAKLASGAIASQAQAEGGINEDTLLTPLRVKQAIDALAPATQNATEIAAGRMELATLAETAAHTALGGSGASLAIQNKYTSKTPDRYTPAYMTGGTAAEGNYAIWDNVSDGEFAITINGTARDVTGIDFSTVTSMADVATAIQTAIRALTSSTETVAWSTDHFVITSVSSVSTSEISVTSAVGGGTGTDISGVGTVYMDSETGRGTATAAVLDKTLDAGMVQLINDSGEIDYRRVPAASTAEAEAGTNDVKFMTPEKTKAATDLVTPDVYVLGAQTRSTGDGSGTQVFTGVGFTPKLITISSAYQHGAAEVCKCDGFDNGTNHSCAFMEASNQVALTADTYGDRCVHLSSQGTVKWTGYVSAISSDGFTITWVASSPAADAKFSFSCIG